MSKPHILLLNGPNLNLLGLREPHIYGSTTLPALTTTLKSHASTLGLHLTAFQSNHEGAILDHLHSHYPQAQLPTSQTPHTPFDFIIINPGALTHTSIALRDALLGIGVPFVEVHVSNVHAREEFRHRSFLSDRAEAVICGLGVWGYEVAVGFAARYLAAKGVLGAEGKGEGQELG
ncbi:catabolic 3-dehydroquinase [Pseudovirgaria hyperparasitica]|uniref:Catabolic 3-dehydroquinase n=1 Tax=Pseudovirgaria hyperparasitica TaxID=470096 RepID=A0A6A6WIA6_9PEZI|nr:catabolic 3-dehydroquinase [Pseudovirgaria hyperparasitica]KAF2762518.1 catabolic 3-dehydroquinase [Pseudovirgaria hyperparasitica]